MFQDAWEAEHEPFGTGGGVMQRTSLAIIGLAVIMAIAVGGVTGRMAGGSNEPERALDFDAPTVTATAESIIMTPISTPNQDSTPAATSNRLSGSAGSEVSPSGSLTTKQVREVPLGTAISP